MQFSSAVFANRVWTYLKSLGHLGRKHRELRESEMSRGNGYSFAIGQVGAVSFYEFLKLLEFSNGPAAFRRQTTQPRGRVFNFLPRPIRQMPGNHRCIQSMVYDLLTSYRAC